MAIHQKRPERRNIEQRATYQAYRPELREDFNGACGYCDDSDRYLDKIGFHVDHFAPQKNFPHLRTAYGNLVYACRFCNIKKSNRWIANDPAVPHNGVEGFVDPCNIDYDNHLERDPSGRILARTSVGVYMVRHLNLSLLRHELLWKARRARQLRDQISELLETVDAAMAETEKDSLELLREFRVLSLKIDKYEALAADG